MTHSSQAALAAVDAAATFFSDGRFSVDGRSSLVLSSPVHGSGVTLSPYTLPKLEANAVYTFSVWTRGSEGGETVAERMERGRNNPSST